MSKLTEADYAELELRTLATVANKLGFPSQKELNDLNDKLVAANREIESLESKVESLESLRPHWAKGYSSDSIAAQSSTAALSSIWELLGASSQTEAMGKLRELLAQK